jgi:hypothetical protein
MLLLFDLTLKNCNANKPVSPQAASDIASSDSLFSVLAVNKMNDSGQIPGTSGIGN